MPTGGWLALHAADGSVVGRSTRSLGGMVYIVRIRRVSGFPVVLGGLLFAASLFTGSLPFPHAFIALIKATVAGFALFLVVWGVLVMVFSKSIVHADPSGVTLYSAILPRAVVFLPWQEIASIDVTVRQFPGEQTLTPALRRNFDLPILVIRTTTPGRRSRGCVNRSRSRLQDAMFEVDLEDPRNIAWVLHHVSTLPVTISQGINAVRARAQRNKSSGGSRQQHAEQLLHNPQGKA